MTLILVDWITYGWIKLMLLLNFTSKPYFYIYDVINGIIMNFSMKYLVIRIFFLLSITVAKFMALPFVASKK